MNAGITRCTWASCRSGATAGCGRRLLWNGCAVVWAERRGKGSMMSCFSAARPELSHELPAKDSTPRFRKLATRRSHAYTDLRHSHRPLRAMPCLPSCVPSASSSSPLPCSPAWPSDSFDSPSFREQRSHSRSCPSDNNLRRPNEHHPSRVSAIPNEHSGCCFPGGATIGVAGLSWSSPRPSFDGTARASGSSGDGSPAANPDGPPSRQMSRL